MISKEDFHEKLDTMFDREKWQVWEKKLKTDKIVKITVGAIFIALALTMIILARYISVMLYMSLPFILLVAVITSIIY